MITSESMKLSLTETLRKLAEEDKEQDRKRPFDNFQEQRIIHLLVDYPAKFTKALSLLHPFCFKMAECQYLCHLMHEFVREGIGMPTRDLLKHVIMHANTVDEDRARTALNILDEKFPIPEMTYVSKSLMDWLMHTNNNRLLASDEHLNALMSGDHTTVFNNYDEARKFHADINSDGKPKWRNIVQMSAEYGDAGQRDWLVKDVIERDQNGLFGGHEKTLKTTIFCDLAVSLGTGTKFLNYFEVPKIVPVSFLTAEGGGRHIYNKMMTVLTARGLTMRDIEHTVKIRTIPPNLADPAQIAALKSDVSEHRSEVAILDPIGKMLGGKDIEHSNIFDMYHILTTIEEALREVGATMLTSHHYKKGADGIGLRHFAYAGFAEWARQSFQIERVGAFTDPRHQSLRFQTHGEGNGRTYRLIANEGIEGARKWQTIVSTEQEVAQTESENRVNKAVGQIVEKITALWEAGDRQITRNKIDPKHKIADWADLIDQALESGLLLKHTETINKQPTIIYSPGTIPQ